MQPKAKQQDFNGILRLGIEAKALCQLNQIGWCAGNGHYFACPLAMRLVGIVADVNVSAVNPINGAKVFTEVTQSLQ